VSKQQQPRWRLTRRQKLWTVGIIVALAGVLVFLCLAYAREWRWTGLVTYENSHAKTLWDWLDLLIVPAVLALGGYLFARSENQRMQKTAYDERTLDRQIADERQRDDTLQAYLDGMSQLLTDKEPPLHRAQPGDSLCTVARARTLTVLGRLDGVGKRNVLQFLFESGLIHKEHTFRNTLDMIEWRHTIVSLKQAKLGKANLRRADLRRVDLRRADLSKANLSEANLRGGLGCSEKQLIAARSLEGATMPNGQKYEDWLKAREGSKEEKDR
jgi:Pentapeptide repeats (8 copies)